MTNIIYFDNAATTVNKPKKIIKEIINSIKNHGNPSRGGYNLSLNAAQKIFNTRLSVANLFKSNSPEKVVFTSNATMSLNMAIKCFIKPDSHVIISCFEHNSVYRPVEALKQNKSLNINYDIFDVSLENDEKNVKNAANLIKENTGMIIITHVSNVCGKILPIKDIIKKAKEKNPRIISIVDASQSAGTLDIDINENNIDILCVPAHKGLMGISGLGIMVFGDNFDLDKIASTTIFEGGTGINSLDLSMPTETPERFEAGTPNMPAISALSASLEYIHEQTLEKIHNHEKLLYDKAIEMLKSLKNVNLFSDFTSKNYTGAILFNINGFKCEEIAGILNKNQIYTRDGYHCSPLSHKKLGTLDTGGIRISFGYFNTEKELDKFYNVIKKI